MNHDQENKLPGTESDPMVSAEYRATATERTPPALDAAVLKKAEAAARESGLQRFTAFWFRPLAFVATLGLALALVLDFTSMQTLQPAMDQEFEAARQETHSLQAVPSNNADNRTTDFYFKFDSPAGKQQSAEPAARAQEFAPEVESGRQRPEPAPALTNENKASGVSDSASAPAGEERVSADFAEMIEASSRKMPQNDIATETAIQNLGQASVTDDSEAGHVSVYWTPTAATIVTTRPCTEEQTASPMTWWHCISDLEEAGRHHEARAEMDLFNKTHPDFKAPEVLPSQ